MVRRADEKGIDMILNEAIQIMTNEIVTVLADNKPTIYLFGSVTLDDFQLGWSDIDILVLTDSEITEQQAETLVGLRQALLEHYPGNPYFRLFEGGISGTAGAGKTALGQLIESKSDYIFIDGDAISKRVNHYARLDPSAAVPDYQMETIRTMLVLLGLGYDVVVGYVINQEVIKWYREGLAKYQIMTVFRVLVPERNVCLQRDIHRECWTAGVEYVDRWLKSQEYMMK